jgi:hypothetical protein
MSESFADMMGNYCTPTVGIGLLIAVGIIIALFALFVLHTLTVWISGDPELAFHRARQWVGYTSSGWNSARTLYNGAKKVAFYWVPGTHRRTAFMHTLFHVHSFRLYPQIGTCLQST